VAALGEIIKFFEILYYFRAQGVEVNVANQFQKKHGKKHGDVHWIIDLQRNNRMIHR